jgi:hypothetical protein
MVWMVIPVPVAIGEVKATDERGLVVYDDDLLVMAVDEMLSRIEGHAHTRPLEQGGPVTANITPIGSDHGERSACPEQHTNVGLAGHLGK